MRFHTDSIQEKLESKVDANHKSDVRIVSVDEEKPTTAMSPLVGNGIIVKNGDNLRTVVVTTHIVTLAARRV